MTMSKKNCASPSPETAKTDGLKQLGFVPELSGKVRVEEGSKPGLVATSRLDTASPLTQALTQAHRSDDRSPELQDGI